MCCGRTRSRFQSQLLAVLEFAVVVWVRPAQGHLPSTQFVVLALILVSLVICYCLILRAFPCERNRDRLAAIRGTMAPRE
jgi:hypothetical protein